MKQILRPAAALLMALLAILGAAAAGNGPSPLPASATEAVLTPEPTPAPEAPPEYTLRFASESLPAGWSPLTPEEGISEALRRLLTAGLYELDYPEMGDGCTYRPGMAAAAPEDVTALYAARLGISAEETRRAWRIPLREDLCWQDGTPITASDFVESARRLLDPELRYPRASLFCEGDLALTGARDYWNQNIPILVENALYARYTLEDLTRREDGRYCTPEGYDVFLALDYPLSYLLYGECLRFYVETYGDKCFELSPWEELLSLMDEDGLVPLTEESYALFRTLTTGNSVWGDTEATLPWYFVCAAHAPLVRWSDVGIMAPDEHSLVFLLEKPLEGDALLRALAERCLVNPSLYDACLSEAEGAPLSLYGTDTASILSCGPYVLAEWQPGAGCTLLRNPRYFESEENGDVFQTTRLEITLVSGEREALDRFEGGLADLCLITGMPLLPEGETGKVIPEGTVYLLAMNPDFQILSARQAEAGEHINKTILTIPQFREALSRGLDRAAYCASASPRNRPALGLISPRILSDPAAGVPYRSTPQGQRVLADYWGSAAESGGYDPERARELFAEAWAAALEAGYLTEEDTVEITVGVPDPASEAYRQGFNALRSQYTGLLEGTPLEGKLRFLLSEDTETDPLTAIRQGRVDLLLGVGWAGKALEPEELMEAYLEGAYRYDPAWDPEAERLTLPLGEGNCTAPLMDWYAILRGETREVTASDGRSLTLSPENADDLRSGILAALEEALLRNGDVIPLSESGSTLLYSERLLPGEGEYIEGLGFGGLRHLRFACSDGEWAEMTGNGQ